MIVLLLRFRARVCPVPHLVTYRDFPAIQLQLPDQRRTRGCDLPRWRLTALPDLEVAHHLVEPDLDVPGHPLQCKKYMMFSIFLHNTCTRDTISLLHCWVASNKKWRQVVLSIILMIISSMIFNQFVSLIINMEGNNPIAHRINRVPADCCRII